MQVMTAMTLVNEPGPAQGNRFRAARDLRGLTQAEVVGRMEKSISTAALSQIESGRSRPTPETVRQLAAVLEVPEGFFAKPWPAGPGDTVALTYFRDLRATAQRERRRAGVLAVLLEDLIAALEQHVRLPDVTIPIIDVGPSASAQEIDAAALSVRKEWGLDDEPIPHAVRELERHGIAVARLSMGHRFVDGFSVRFARRPLVLLARDKSNYVRSRFDASHELGHLVMHGKAEPGKRVVEDQAHDFAASFLLPTDVALDLLPTRLDAAGWATLASMKQRWGLSMAALLYRAKALKIISAETYRNAMKYMSARGWRTAEPGDREMGHPETPVLLERALRRVEVDAHLSIVDTLESAQLPVRDVMELVEGSTDSRPIIEL
jgi:Zn-dependent peptidase ImmA (M78 family)/transcriptional regulator with XRE-family HTH domain